MQHCGRCHLIAPPSLITSQPPAKLRIMKGLGWQLTLTISSLISKHGCLQYFPSWEILRRFRDTTNSLSSVTNDPRPGTEYTDNYLLSSGFWPRVKLKNYHHPVRPLSFKRFQQILGPCTRVQRYFKWEDLGCSKIRNTCFTSTF